MFPWQLKVKRWLSGIKGYSAHVFGGHSILFCLPDTRCFHLCGGRLTHFLTFGPTCLDFDGVDRPFISKFFFCVMPVLSLVSLFFSGQVTFANEIYGLSNLRGSINIVEVRYAHSAPDRGLVIRSRVYLPYNACLRGGWTLHCLWLSAPVWKRSTPESSHLFFVMFHCREREKRWKKYIWVIHSPEIASADMLLWGDWCNEHLLY